MARIDEAFVEILPDFSQFSRRISRGFANATSGLEDSAKRAADSVSEAFGKAADDIDKDMSQSLNKVGDDLEKTGIAGKAAFGTLGVSAGVFAQTLTSTVTPAVGLIATIPAIAGVAGAGLATLGVATAGVGDAFAAAFEDAEAFDEAIEGLSPAAQDTAVAFRELVPQFEALQDSVQDAFFQDLDDSLNSVADSLLGPVQEGMTGAAGAAGGLVQSLAGVLASGTGVEFVESAFSGLETLFTELQGPLSSLLEGVLQLATVITDAFAGDASAALGGIIEQLGEFLSAISESGVAVEIVDSALAVFGELATLLEPMVAVISAITGAFSGVGEVLASALGGAVRTIIPALVDTIDALAPVVSLVADAFAELISVAAPVIAQILSAITPLIDPILRIGQVIIDVVVQAFSILAPVIGQVADILSSILGPILNIVADIFEQLSPTITLLFEAFQPLIDAFLILFEALTPLFEILEPFIALIGEIIGSVVESLVPAIEALANIFLFIVEEVIVPFVIPILETIIETLVNILGPAFEDTGEVIGMVFEAVADALDDFETFFEGIIDTISSIWSGLGDALKATGDFIENNVIDPIENAISGMVGFFEDAGDSIGDAFDGAVDGIKGALNGIIDAYNGLDVEIGPWTIPDWVPLVGGNSFYIPDIFPDAPRLQTGGIVTEATPAMLHANEMVLPLSGSVLGDLGESIAAAGGGGGEIIVNVQIGERDINDMINTEILRNNRVTSRRIRAGAGRSA